MYPTIQRVGNPNYFYYTEGIDLYLSIYVQHVKILTKNWTFTAKPGALQTYFLWCPEGELLSRLGTHPSINRLEAESATSAAHVSDQVPLRPGISYRPHQHARRQRWLCAE